jgi:acetyl esterase/lipase
VLVYIHGGAWWKGEKPAGWGGFRAYLAAGFSVVTVEYRLTDVAPAPAAVQDVRCALSWVKTNAKAYGFDAKRVVPYGTSAGGHLALMAGMLPKGNDRPAGLPRPADRAGDPRFLRTLSPAADLPGAFKSPSTARWIGDGPDGAVADDVAGELTCAKASRRCSSFMAIRTRPCLTRRRWR